MPPSIAIATPVLGGPGTMRVVLNSSSTFGKRRGGRSDRGHLSGKPQTSQSAMLATATTPPGFPLVWSGVPTATYTMVGYDAGTLDIQVNAMQRLSTENSPEH